MADTDLEEKGPRRILMAGATLLIAGLALVGTRWAGPGSAVTLVGLAVTIYAIHAFGRLGPEEPAGSGAEVERAAAKQRLVSGILIVIVALTVAIAASMSLAPDGSRDVALLALLAGAFRGIRAAMALTPKRRERRPARAKG
jgi:hypothetical protein